MEPTSKFKVELVERMRVAAIDEAGLVELRHLDGRKLGRTSTRGSAKTDPLQSLMVGIDAPQDLKAGEEVDVVRVLLVMQPGHVGGRYHFRIVRDAEVMANRENKKTNRKDDRHGAQA